MKTPFVFCVCFALIVSSHTLFAQNDDDKDIRAAIKDFYQSFQIKDETKLHQFWKSDSPHFDEFKKQTNAFFAENKSITLENLDFYNSNFKDEIFRQRISVEIQGKPQNLTFLFVKEKYVWQIWRIRLSEEDIVFQIAGAENDTERETLIASSQDLQTAALCVSAVNEGRNSRNRGDLLKANRILDFADNLAKLLKDDTCLGKSLSLRGSVKFRETNYAEATKVLFEGLDIAIKLNDLSLISDIYVNLGLTVMLQGNFNLGKEYYEKSLSLAEKIGDKGKMARVLNNLANISGDPKISIPLYERVFKLAEESNTPHLAAYAIGNTGHAYASLGDYEKAIEHLHEARKRLESLDFQYDLIEAYMTLAEYYFKLEKYSDALIWAEKSYAQSVKTNSQRDGNPTPLFRMFEVQRKLGDLAAARKSAEESVKIVEKFREQSLSDETTKTRFLNIRFQSYHNLILILNDLGEYEKALEASEFYKGRVLWDVLRTGKANLSKAMSAEERIREKRLKEKVDDANRVLIEENQKEYKNQSRVSELDKHLKQTRFTLEEFQIRLFASKPELKIQRGEFQPISLAEISALFPNEQTAFLEFAVTNEKTFLYVVTKEKGKPTLQVYPIAREKKDLQEKADAFLKTVSDPKINLDYKQNARELFDLLLTPALGQLRGKTSLVIVPDSFLWEIPFQALVSSENRFLIEDFTISYAPSLTVLREMKKIPGGLSANPKLLAFGNPKFDPINTATLEKVRGSKLEDLPSAEKEVEFLGKLYGTKQSRIYKGATATETIFKENSKGFDILHFATHGILNDQSPLYSALVLSAANNSTEDGLLEAGELMEMNLDADLAVLSACETGRGTHIGEGIIGLSWAFFIAGTPRVVASQWKVESASTAALMTDFHRQMRLTPNDPIAKSLQKAMRKQLKTPRYRHPFYWSGFISIGKD